MLAYIRKAKDPNDYLIVVCNFTPVPRTDYRIGVPEAAAGTRKSSTATHQFYGGSNVGNYPGLESVAVPCHGRSHSIQLDFPPLGVNIFRLEG